jgi:hypothetical protein
VSKRRNLQRRIAKKEQRAADRLVAKLTPEERQALAILIAQQRVKPDA